LFEDEKDKRWKMSNGSVGSTKVSSTQAPQTPIPPAQSQKPEAKAEDTPVKALSEQSKGTIKTLHHFGATANEAALRAKVTGQKAADPSIDSRRDQVSKMIKDGTLDSKEAKDVINLAKDDAKLAAGEKDPKKLEPALINIYVRSGVSVDEARKLAGRTMEIAKDGNGSASVSLQPTKEKMTPEKADKIRTEAEESTKGNRPADEKWSVDKIKQDRAGFMRNVVQIDGDKGTTSDFKACAATSLVGGMILSKPESVQDLAKKLQTPEGAKEFPGFQKEPGKGAIDRIANGNFSPRDVNVLANGLYASTRYTKYDGHETEGMPISTQIALQGKFRNIGFTPPVMRQDTYGTFDRQGTHVTSFAHNTGYDPWPYPGSNGQSTLSDGEAAARNQGLSMGPRLGFPNQKRFQLESMQQDGAGGIILERHMVDGRGVDPPLKARYTYNPNEKRWERDASVKVPEWHEENLPKYIPVDVEKRRDMKIEKE
jgi:hypothetical protein